VTNRNTDSSENECQDLAVLGKANQPKTRERGRRQDEGKLLASRENDTSGGGGGEKV
jgi:hypothetical protein